MVGDRRPISFKKNDNFRISIEIFINILVNLPFKLSNAARKLHLEVEAPLSLHHCSSLFLFWTLYLNTSLMQRQVI